MADSIGETGKACRMGTTPVVVPTVAAKVLLGWMERDQAVTYLRNECVFPNPISEEEATEMWRIRNERVHALVPVDDV